MENKEDGAKRPCYFCFRDRKNKEIIWFIPISTKYDKYKKIYDNKNQKLVINQYTILFLEMFWEKKPYF